MLEDRAEPDTGTQDPTGVPPGIDLTRPSVARVYDYALGGKEHFEIDRIAAAAAYEVVPEMSQLRRIGRQVAEAAGRTSRRSPLTPTAPSCVRSSTSTGRSP